MKKSIIIAATTLALFSTGIVPSFNSGNVVLANSKQYKSINKDLAKNLKQDQSYADSDSDNFGYSKYISKIKYTGNGDLDIYVSGGFKDLSNAEKTDVLNKTQSLAKMVLTQDDEDSDISKGFVVEAFDGKNSVAVSKISNRKAYHFN